MGEFWKFTKEAVKGFAGSISVMYESDSLMKELTGINPKHFHPDVYKFVSEQTREKWIYYHRIQNDPLTVEETTLIKLMFFWAVADKGNDTEKRRIFSDAMENLRNWRGHRIRGEISMRSIAECG